MFILNIIYLFINEPEPTIAIQTTFNLEARRSEESTPLRGQTRSYYLAIVDTGLAGNPKFLLRYCCTEGLINTFGVLEDSLTRITPVTTSLENYTFHIFTFFLLLSFNFLTISFYHFLFYHYLADFS